MRDIGLHLRLTESFTDLAHKAIALQLPIFQCFLLRQSTTRLVQPTLQDINSFTALRDHFKDLFIHATYWTNFASPQDISLNVFKKELTLAQRLGFNYMVIHPGSAKGALSKEVGLDRLVMRLNHILHYARDMRIVLENTAHGDLSIGGDLYDFKYVLDRCEYPEKLFFCIDTAHAHVWGYPLATSDDQNNFFNIIAQTIGFERIVLLHLNNTDQPCGSHIDKHVALDQGVFDVATLKSFILHPQLMHVPIIMELPVCDGQAEKQALEQVKGWHNITGKSFPRSP